MGKLHYGLPGEINIAAILDGECLQILMSQSMQKPLGNKSKTTQP